MRLIDADWLEGLLLMHEQNARAMETSGRKVSFTYADGIRAGYANVGLCPTIDADPIRHGEWIGTEFDGYADGYPVFYEWKCSVCGCLVEDDEPTWNYCPNCGARMDGGEEYGKND